MARNAALLALAREGALGWHEGKLAFLYEHGLRVRWTLTRCNGWWRSSPA